MSIRTNIHTYVHTMSKSNISDININMIIHDENDSISLTYVREEVNEWYQNHEEFVLGQKHELSGLDQVDLIYILSFALMLMANEECDLVEGCSVNDSCPDNLSEWIRILLESAIFIAKTKEDNDRFLEACKFVNLDPNEAFEVKFGTGKTTYYVGYEVAGVKYVRYNPEQNNTDFS